ncbi:MAG: single-stranded-DNA-specific exonuclease RecJ [Candidatus Melainabacteria bacterium]|nr:single-stranded-DNA-specific exonuclease RecJ [Candidatus Melainabacteria bacterium]
MKYKWLIKEHREITKEFLIEKLLSNRGINSQEKAKAYLDPKFYKESLSEEIPDLIKAKDRIVEAINKKEKITIFGDYDVDGVTATSCLLITLKEFTNNVDFYMPNRLTEGYGLNLDAVKKIAETNGHSSLLVTCDCGITNHKEIEFANSLGLDVIVTDHHSLPEILPSAYAVLNPKLLPQDHKLHWLPGVGVAYKLAQVILEERNGDGAKGRIGEEELLDLVCLGMIADLAPLVDENRYLVQIGLPKLASTKKVGLQELLKICGFMNKRGQGVVNHAPTTDHIGFGIAPRINAIGRLADASLAVKLLTTNNSLEAARIAFELDTQNKQRQSLCEETLKEAMEMISNQQSAVSTQLDKCIVLAKESWHHGVIGIVASRIVEKYNLPTILIAIDKDQNIARGSGRSTEHLNIIEAITSCSTHLEKFGGHKLACGLSIKPENINNFIFDFKNHVNNLLFDSNMEPILKIDFELPLINLNLKLMSEIYKLSPFGLGNPIPVFVSEEVEIVNIRNIGKNGQHLKLTIEPANRRIGDGANKYISRLEALIWNHNNKADFNIGDKVKLAYTPKLNFYNSEIFIQLEVKDWYVMEKSKEKEMQAEALV